MNIDELRLKIEELCIALNTSNLDPRIRTMLEDELEQTCINYYKLRRGRS
ncbi:hypothetical protein SDC9_09173 [bioreactor metagenome]|uniref:Uncharacterized protein n=1 Tax=bioreactor metagenome TaxID=1076179 RepID=A0A644T9B4_9ZZZZ